MSVGNRLRRLARFIVLSSMLVAPAARADGPIAKDPSLHPQSLPLPPVTGSPEAVRLFRRGQRREAFAFVTFFTGLALTVNGGYFIGAGDADTRFVSACNSDKPECAYARDQQRVHLGAGIAMLAVGAASVGIGLTYFVLGTRDVRRAKKMDLQIWVRPETGPAGPSGGQLQLALRF